MITKVMNYHIVKPLNCDWELFGKVLSQLQFETRLIANKVIQYCWEWDGFSSDYKSQLNEYPKPKDIVGLTLDGYIYKQISQSFNKLNTGNLSMTLKKHQQNGNR